MAASEQLNLPLVAYVAPKHAGSLGRTFSMLESSTPQIGVRALKKAEDGDGYIVRCYELTGKPVENARITFPAQILSAEECNGIEERIGDAARILEAQNEVLYAEERANAEPRENER